MLLFVLNRFIQLTSFPCIYIFFYIFFSRFEDSLQKVLRGHRQRGRTERQDMDDITERRVPKDSAGVVTRYGRWARALVSQPRRVRGHTARVCD